MLSRPLGWRFLFGGLAAGFALWTVSLLAQSPPLPFRPSPRVVSARPALGEVPVTFNNQVVRILQARCQTCHRPGGIAPFSLVSYGDAFVNRVNIVLQTSQRRMPPWHVNAACAAYEDDPSLTQAEIDTFARWVSAGAPQGDPRDLPEPRVFPDGWELGPPDSVLTMAEPMTPRFDGGDVYRCFVLPTSFPEDRFVSAV